MNTCGTCQKWDVSRPIAPGFGHCTGRQEPWRWSVSTAAHAVCRIGLFEAKKQGDAAGTPKIAKDRLEAHSEAGKPPSEPFGD